MAATTTPPTLTTLPAEIQVTVFVHLFAELSCIRILNVPAPPESHSKLERSYPYVSRVLLVSRAVHKQTKLALMKVIDELHFERNALLIDLFPAPLPAYILQNVKKIVLDYQDYSCLPDCLDFHSLPALKAVYIRDKYILPIDSKKSLAKGYYETKGAAVELMFKSMETFKGTVERGDHEEILDWLKVLQNREDAREISVQIFTRRDAAPRYKHQRDALVAAGHELKELWVWWDYWTEELLSFQVHKAYQIPEWREEDLDDEWRIKRF